MSYQTINVFASALVQKSLLCCGEKNSLNFIYETAVSL